MNRQLQVVGGQRSIVGRLVGMFVSLVVVVVLVKLGILFVNDPVAAADRVKGFVGSISRGVDAVLTFLDSVFD